MKLIVGLGNPGLQYEKTRHNLGFIFLERFRENNNFSEFTLESKFKAGISTGDFQGEKTLLIKPQTFMNLSGESVRKIIDYYKLNILDDLIIIYDDISMDFGKIRVRKTGSAGGHNGIKDIIQKFSPDFRRIKVGVGYDSRYDVSDWVLSKFSEEELIDLDNEMYNGIMGTLRDFFLER